MAIDPSVLVGYTVQLNSLQMQAASATDPTVKAFLNSQISTVTAQLSAEALHQQTQADASSNVLQSLGLMSTLTSTVGNLAPSIINLFHP
jgi:hypothetical protein